MSIIQTVYASLREEGYKPMLGDAGGLTFKYYGQAANFRTKELGAITVAELECMLPRPEMSAQAMQEFSGSHPLSKLSGRNGRLCLTLETMFTLREVGEQLSSLLKLLDQYTADLVFGTGAAEVPAQAPSPVQNPSILPRTGVSSVSVAQREEAIARTHVPSRPELSSVPAPVERPAAAAPVAEKVPEQALSSEWETSLGLLHERFHPLARALAQAGAPAPDEVQMDMMQGQQVKGTAIMMWGTPPEAVVVCEQGQSIPAGYQGGVWYSHLTPAQMAEEMMAHLKVARRQ